MNHVVKKLSLLLPGALLLTCLAPPGKAAAQNPPEMQRELDTARSAKLEAALAESLAVTARMKAENEQLKKELAKLAGQVASRRGGTSTTGTTAAPPLPKEVEALREQLRQVRAERDKTLQSVVELTDQLHKAFGEVKRLKEENTRLTAWLPPPPPKGLEGLVTATAKNGLVEISLGSEDGLKPGHQLSVCRAKGKALDVLGEVVVVNAAPDKAICRVVTESLKGATRKGDRVTTGERPGPPPPPQAPKAGEPPLLLGGTVLAVLEEGQVEISFGAADGLRPGHRLEVYRQTGSLGIYVGQVEVVQAGPKKSRCKIVLEQDTVRKGDRITSKL
jgi:hypothetical protein